MTNVHITASTTAATPRAQGPKAAPSVADETQASGGFEVLLAIGIDSVTAQLAGDKTDHAEGDALQAASDAQTALANPAIVPPLIPRGIDPGSKASVTDAAAREIINTLGARRPGNSGRGLDEGDKRAVELPAIDTRHTGGRSERAVDALQTGLKPDPESIRTATERFQAAPPLENTTPQTLLHAPGATIAPPSASQPQATTTSHEVHEPVGTSRWAESFAQRVMVAVGGGEQIAEIKLNPPHLGPIEVSLSLTGDDAKHAAVHFTAQHAAVRDAIESALPRLREMFSDAGLSLGNATVGSEAFTREDSGNEARGGRPASGAAGDDATVAQTQSAPMTRTPGLVDTFA